MRAYILSFTGLLLPCKAPVNGKPVKSAHIITVKPYRSVALFWVALFLTAYAAKANITYTWTGAHNNNWADSTNWSPVSFSGGPTGCNADVIIPVTANSPFVTASVNVGNVTMADNAVLTLKASLILCQNLTGGSSAYAIINGPGVVIFTSNNAQTITGKTQMGELYLDNQLGVAMQPGSALDIYTALDLKNGNFNATAGTLTLKSNNADSVAIIDNFTEGNSTGTITGNVTVERYYNSSSTYSQHYMGAPVNNIPVSQFGASGTAGFVQDPACDETRSLSTSPYGTLFSFNEANGAACGLQQWEVVTTGNTQNLAGYSFLSQGAGKLTLTGTANLDTMYTIGGLTNSGWYNTSMQGHTYNSGWQLISNPYMASLNITQGSAGFDNQVQTWNTDGPYAGSYQPGMIGTDALVAPFQAFMVHKTTAGGTATYTINGNQRVRDVHTFYQQAANQLTVVATNTANGLMDKTSVAFNLSANDSFDPQYDAVKFAGALNRHTIYTVAAGVWMARNVLHNADVTNTVAMGFEPGATGSYTLSFTGVSTFAPTATIYLEDKVTHTMFNIRNGNYAFTADSADAWNRFVLHFIPAVQVNVANATCTDTGSVTLAQTGPWGSYIIVDSNKATLTSGILSPDQGVTISLPAGTYTITLTDSTGLSASQSIVISGMAYAMPVADFQITTGASLVAINQAQAGERVEVTATIGGPATYYWNFGDGVQDSDGVASTVYKAAGTYVIGLVAVNPAGCTASTQQTITITEGTTGIYNITGNGGPAIWSNNNTVYVDFRDVADMNATVNIYDVSGKQLSSERSGQLLYQKQIDNISAGYFIIDVNNNDKTTTKKVFIGNAR